MWNLLINNHSCNEKEILRTTKIHLEKLIKTKTNIDNKSPKIPLFLKNKIYLRQYIKAKDRKIKIGNYFMYDKLASLVTTCSPYSQTRNIPKYCPAFDKKKFDYSRIERERTISIENQSFYKRFIQRKTNYPVTKFLKKSKYEQYIKHNISKAKFFPKVTFKLCTFNEFKYNVMKESSVGKENSFHLNETNISLISKSKSKNHKRYLNNTFYKNSNNNNSINKKNLISQNSIFKPKKVRRCQSVKHRCFNKITYDY